MTRFLDLLTRNRIFPLLIAGIAPLIIVSAILLSRSIDALHEEAELAETALRAEVESRLVAIRDGKRAGIERYFKQIHDQALTFSESRMAIDAMRKLRGAFHTYRAESSTSDRDLARMKPELQG